MKTTDGKKFSKVLGAIAIACGKELSELTLEVYFTALKDFSIEEVERAGMALLKTWTHPGMLPTPAQFIEFIQGDPASNSTFAVETIHLAMENSGAYQSVRFEDQALMATVDHFGGWVPICQKYREARPQDVSYFEHEFKTVYQQHAKHRKPFQYKYFPGIFEINNSTANIERGRLPEPQVDCYGVGEKMLRLPLSKISPKTEIVERAQKQVEAAKEEESCLSFQSQTKGVPVKTQ